MKLTKKELARIDALVLMACDRPMPTYVIRNSIALSDVKTDAILRSCRRNEKAGLMRVCPMPYHLASWMLTEAGRAALKEMGE